MLPVHHGGKLFSEALNSVVPFASLFTEILISINSGEANDVDLEIVGSLPSDLQNLHVLVHASEMSAPAHFGKIIQGDTFLSFLDTDMVLLLFHDDIFLGTNFNKLMQSAKIDAASVVIGEWQITRDREKFSLIDAGIRDGMSPGEWIKSMGFRGFQFTNGSGMIVPVKVLREYARWANHSKKGARFEYFMCTHRSVDTLIKSTPAIVQLYQHSQQEGANVHPAEAAWDEVLFQLWLFRQGRRNNFWFALQGVTLIFIHLSLFFLRNISQRRNQSKSKSFN